MIKLKKGVKIIFEQYESFEFVVEKKILQNQKKIPNI